MSGFHINFMFTQTAERQKQLKEALSDFGIDEDTYKALEFVFRLCMSYGPTNRFSGYRYNANYKPDRIRQMIRAVSSEKRLEILTEEANRSHSQHQNFGIEFLEITKQSILHDSIAPYKEFKKMLDQQLLVPNKYGHALISTNDHGQILKQLQQVVINAIEYDHQSNERFFKLRDSGEYEITWNRLPYFKDYLALQYGVYAKYMRHKMGSRRRTAIFKWISFKICFDHKRAGDFDENFFKENFSPRKIKDRLHSNSAALKEKFKFPYRFGLLSEDFVNYLSEKDDPLTECA